LKLDGGFSGDDIFAHLGSVAKKFRLVMENLNTTKSKGAEGVPSEEVQGIDDRIDLVVGKVDGWIE
jgi:negative regulator of genetic competence, sporulation and motility